MELRVFDKTVQPLGAIDELASLLWHTKYFDVGTFSLLAPITDNNSRLLVEGNLITKHDEKKEVKTADGGVWRRAAQITYVHITKDENGLDQFIKHELGVEAYIRYMDDFVILSPDKEQLRSWLARIEQFLREELRLEFNPKTTILAAKNGIDFVGYKHRATHRKVRKDSIKRIKRTIKKCESGKITKEQLQKSIQSWTGHAGHADSYNLRKKIETLAEAAIEKAA
ncbi:hypothetical protein LIR34_08450 [Blautia sp. MSK17_66]|uniref:RNA-directed DNA polymerase n=1 Tax=Blautia TaxID=572511 RepID=UPI001FC82B6D|nr:MULTISPECIES: RNA-directed DNA polymerase [Blautia]MCB5549849.1 hypothetical protein [Blautia sp. MSK17_66]NSK00326.1 hypothetical protein [Blautia obeum]